MSTRRVLLLILLLALALACSMPSSFLSSAAVLKYPDAAALDVEPGDALKLITSEFPGGDGYLAYEGESRLSTTEESQGDVQDYFDEKLDSSGWEMETDDWREFYDNLSFSIWSKGSQFVLVGIIHDLSSDQVDYLEREYDIEDMDRDLTLIVTHSWDGDKLSTTGSEPPDGWEEEKIRAYDMVIYIPEDWSTDEYSNTDIELYSAPDSYVADLWLVDDSDASNWGIDFDQDASAFDLLDSMIQERDYHTQGDIETISTQAGEAAYVVYEESGETDFAGILPMGDEAILFTTTGVYDEDEFTALLQMSVYEAIFASIRPEN